MRPPGNLSGLAPRNSWDQGKLFSARHRHFRGKARAGYHRAVAPVVRLGKKGSSLSLPSTTATPFAPRPSPPICVWPPACSVDSSAMDDWIKTPLSSSDAKTILAMRQVQAVTDSSTAPPDCTRGYARVSAGEACPRPNSCGRWGRASMLTADLISGVRGPVTNRPNPPSDHCPARVRWGAGNEDKGGTCSILCFQRRPPPSPSRFIVPASRHWYCSAGSRPRTMSEEAIPPFRPSARPPPPQDHYLSASTGSRKRSPL